MPKKKTKTPRKATTISIHGNGFDIDATIGNPAELGAFVETLADRLTGRLMGGFVSGDGVVPPVPGPTIAPEHHFDIVKSVIDHGEVTVLEAIVRLANHELEKRRTATSDSDRSPS